jgi:hypothetical protein
MALYSTQAFRKNRESNEPSMIANPNQDQEWYYTYVEQAVAKWNATHGYIIDLSQYNVEIMGEINLSGEHTYMVVGTYKFAPEERPQSHLGNWGSQFGYPDFEFTLDPANPESSEIYFVK